MYRSDCPGEICSVWCPGCSSYIHRNGADKGSCIWDWRLFHHCCESKIIVPGYRRLEIFWKDFWYPEFFREGQWFVCFSMQIISVYYFPKNELNLCHFGINLCPTNFICLVIIYFSFSLVLSLLELGLHTVSFWVCVEYFALYHCVC